MLRNLFAPLVVVSRIRLLARCGVWLVSAAILSACGNGYRGYFVWGDPPEPDDDSGLVIVITKAQFNSAQQVVFWRQQQHAVHTASAAVRRDLAHLHTTDERTCESAAVVYELLLQSHTSVQRYRSSNWDCGGSADVQVQDYIAAADLARFAALVDQEQ